MEEALTLAHERKLTAYAASYAALAQKLELPLLTSDKPLAEAIESAIWIGDLALDG